MSASSCRKSPRGVVISDMPVPFSMRGPAVRGRGIELAARSTRGLASGRASALCACRLLLRRRAALRRRRTRRAGMRLLAALARGVGAVRDPRRALLGHALVLQRLILLLVLHVRRLGRHLAPPESRTDRRLPCFPTDHGET